LNILVASDYLLTVILYCAAKFGGISHWTCSFCDDLSRLSSMEHWRHNLSYT